MKACSKCGVEHNGKNYCKPCRAEYMKRYRVVGKKQCQEYSRRYYENNRDEILAHLKQRRAALKQ